MSFLSKVKERQIAKLSKPAVGSFKPYTYKGWYLEQTGKGEMAESRITDSSGKLSSMFFTSPKEAEKYIDKKVGSFKPYTFHTEENDEKITIRTEGGSAHLRSMQREEMERWLQGASNKYDYGLIFEHLKVDENMRRQGIASALIREVLKYAKANVLPRCGCLDC